MHFTLSSLLVLISGGLIVYCYIAYPVAIAILAHFRKGLRQVPSTCEDLPFVSIILSAYNEEAVLSRSFTALLELNYPPLRFEILVGSDGSTDRTVEIIRSFEYHPQVHSLCCSERRGKIPILNDLVSRAKGEIILFTDADVILDREALLHHVTFYNNRTIGGVAGNLIFEENHPVGPMKSERQYLSLESDLRENESILGSTVGIFGGNYSCRRDLRAPVPDLPVCDELYTALSIIDGGKRIVFSKHAIAWESFSRSMKDEFERKSRFAARGLHTLFAFPSLLFKPGFLSFILISHKLLRWLTPFLACAMVAVLVWKIVMYSSQFSIVVLSVLFLLTAVAFASGSTSRTRFMNVFSHLRWFIIMNAGFGVGVLRFLFGLEKKFWPQPTRIDDTLEGKVLSSYKKIAA